MRTTVTIPDDVFEAATLEAERAGQSFSQLVESMLRARTGCGSKEDDSSSPRFPGPAANGSQPPGRPLPRPRLPTVATTGGIRAEYRGRPINEVLDEIDQDDRVAKNRVDP